MDARDESEQRDELWESLRALRPEIDRLAAGEFDFTERQRQVVVLLTRIVVAEMDFRERGREPGSLSENE